MKNNVSCPKCGGREIIKIPGKAGAYGSGNNIMIGMTIFSAILVNRYVCSDCGYSEEWIDTKDLEKLKKYYGSKMINFFTLNFPFIPIIR